MIGVKKWKLLGIKIMIKNKPIAETGVAEELEF
jgi:hypothetical protein